MTDIAPDAEANWQGTQLIMREINRIQFLENFKCAAPGLVRELKKQGVVFP